MFGMDMGSMLKMALGMIQIDDQTQLDAIADELRKMDFEPGEKDKVITLLRVALGALDSQTA